MTRSPLKRFLSSTWSALTRTAKDPASSATSSQLKPVPSGSCLWTMTTWQIQDSSRGYSTRAKTVTLSIHGVESATMTLN